MLNLPQMLRHPLAAEGEAARHLRIEDQEFGDLERADLRAIEPAIGAVRRDRAQNRLPLHIVDRTADVRDRRQQQIIFDRSEEHTSELQSLMRISYAVFCLKKKKMNKKHTLVAQDDTPPNASAYNIKPSHKNKQ